MQETLDKNTYGSSKAEVTLVELLNKLNNKKISSYAGRLLESITHKVNNVRCKDAGTEKFLYLLLRKYYFGLITNSKHFKEYPKIITFMKNCAVKRLKKILK